MLGLIISMIGLDPLMGTKRLTFGIQNLAGGISTVPALVGFFGFAEVLSVVYSLGQEQNVLAMEKTKVSLKEVLKALEAVFLYFDHWYAGWCACLAPAVRWHPFIAYNEAKRIVKESGGALWRRC